MTTITTLTSGESGSASLSDINTNFSNLNSGKIETSVIDTDTALAANSDAKLASQKATKAYADTIVGVLASETVAGRFEEATDGEVTSGTATGGTGAKLAVTPAKLATRLTALAYLKAVKTGNATKNTGDANGNQTIAHGLSATPRFVRIDAVMANDTSASATAYLSTAATTYDGSAQSSIYTFIQPAAAGNHASDHGSTFRITAGVRGTDYQTGVVTVDGTNITIAWTKTGSPSGTANLIWEAFA